MIKGLKNKCFFYAGKFGFCNLFRCEKAVATTKF